MNLANLFYMKENFRERIRHWRRRSLAGEVRRSDVRNPRRDIRNSSARSVSPFTLEALEPRILPSVSIADATVTEANAGGAVDVNFVVTLSEAAATDVTVAYQTIEGTARAGVDFAQTVSGPTTPLRIAAGQTSGTITIRTFGDAVAEPDEFYMVELTNVQGASFADGALRARAIGVIQGNDGTGNKLGLFVDDAQLVEGAAGSKDAVFRVKLSQSLLSPLSLNYTTVNGSAVAGTDYQATSGTLLFNPGETLKAVAVPAGLACTVKFHVVP